MRGDRLISIDYNTQHHAVLVVYEPDAEYSTSEIIGYVEDVSEGRSRRIMVYEGETLMHDLRRSDEAGWHDVA